MGDIWVDGSECGAPAMAWKSLLADYKSNEEASRVLIRWVRKVFCLSLSIERPAQQVKLADAVLSTRAFGDPGDRPRKTQLLRIMEQSLGRKTKVLHRQGPGRLGLWEEVFRLSGAQASQFCAIFRCNLDGSERINGGET